MAQVTNQTDTPTVVLMPESDKGALCVAVSGTIRKEDHERVIYRELAERIKRDGHFSMLVHFTPEYKGWEHDAAEVSMKSIVEFGKYARRLAYVNPPEKKILQNKLAAPILGGEIRYFDAEDLPMALKWIKGADAA